MLHLLAPPLLPIHDSDHAAPHGGYRLARVVTVVSAERVGQGLKSTQHDQRRRADGLSVRKYGELAIGADA
ncbi:hypothetical protein ACFQU9_14295 [Actinomadura namibiensis]|uniref:Uncharacterized protein n=1 Tax=Actinomadura namibiensis TaxID=182080 RepID=A0A7W3QS61_ACTNM|nr:hypothetical protein [Actinomadura namibiensis]MBA8957494.1 hypothetical protein [Actinomadura namibiensis]